MMEKPAKPVKTDQPRKEPGRTCCRRGVFMYTTPTFTMSGATKKFCVLTVGRAGSTSLMDYLEKFPDVAVPNKNIPCVDNELLHPKRIQEHMRRYAELCGSPITTQKQLIDGFFAHNAGAAYAGFKTMPDRHTNYDAFVARTDIQFITLTRRDVPSTVASFLMAMKTDFWRRSGEPQQIRWTFNPTKDSRRTRGNLVYIHESLGRLSRVPNAIHLVYEDLCNPKYRNPALDAFFGRPIRIENPKPPTSGSTYVENWEEFCNFVSRVQRRLDSQAG